METPHQNPKQDNIKEPTPLVTPDEMNDTLQNIDKINRSLESERNISMQSMFTYIRTQLDGSESELKKTVTDKLLDAIKDPDAVIRLPDLIYILKTIYSKESHIVASLMKGLAPSTVTVNNNNSETYALPTDDQSNKGGTAVDYQKAKKQAEVLKALIQSEYPETPNTKDVQEVQEVNESE